MIKKIALFFLIFTLVPMVSFSAELTNEQITKLVELKFHIKAGVTIL